MARMIDGNAIASAIRSEVIEGVEELRRRGQTVNLVSLMVGNPDAGEIFSRSQARRCREVGINYRLIKLAQDCGLGQVRQTIEQLNRDPAVNGIMLNLPLPDELEASRVQYCIDPYKDVEGVNPANIGFVFYGRPIIAPCTALSVLEVLQDAGHTIRGKEVVVVGQGPVVGRPITLFLLQEQATVTACHDATADLGQHTARADVLIVAAGQPGLITGAMVRPGALVIDVGINRITDAAGRTVVVGDVDVASVERVAGALTPVPGGVGPITVAILLRNTLQAARVQDALKS